jgi:hypothetical protein
VEHPVVKKLKTASLKDYKTPAKTLLKKENKTKLLLPITKLNNSKHVY